MMISGTAIFRRLLLILPILTIGFWLFAQKGCELTPHASPTRALAAEAGSTLPKPKSRPSERASALLRQAADLIDKNDPQAVKLIRQAIAILKREIMPGIAAQDYDRVSMPSALGLNETFEQQRLGVSTTFQILSCKDRKSYRSL
jgi:hypothetical protein